MNRRRDQLIITGTAPKEVEALTFSVSQDAMGTAYSQGVHFTLSLDYHEIMASFMKQGGLGRAKVDANCAPNLTDNTRKFQLISAGTNIFRSDDIFSKARNLSSTYL